MLVSLYSWDNKSYYPYLAFHMGRYDLEQYGVIHGENINSLQTFESSKKAWFVPDPLAVHINWHFLLTSVGAGLYC